MRADELQRTKQDLRLRMGRLRRQIDGRLRDMDRGRFALTSWSGLLGRHPGWALLAIGLASSPALRERLARIFESRLFERAFDRIAVALWRQLRELWQDVIRPQVERWRGTDEARQRQHEAGGDDEPF